MTRTSIFKRERHIMLRQQMIDHMRNEKAVADLAGVQLTITPIWWWVKRARLQREIRESKMRLAIWRKVLGMDEQMKREQGQDTAHACKNCNDARGESGMKI